MIQRIAVVLRGRIGDLCCTWPLLALLKQRYPGCSLHLFGEPVHRELVSLIPQIDRFWVLPMSRNSYLEGWRYGQRWRGYFDIAIAAHTRPRSWVSWFMMAIGAPQRYAYVDGRRRYGHIHHPRVWDSAYEEAHHESLKLLQLVDPACQTIVPQLLPRLAIPEQLRAKWRGWSGEWLQEQPVTVSISSHRPGCRLTIENWVRTLQPLQDQPVLISHLSQDRDAAANLASRLPHARSIETPSLEQLLLLLETSRLVLSGEGGVSHLAAALDRPQLALYGGTSPIQWKPLSDRAQVLSHPTDVNQIEPAQIEATVRQLAV